MSIQVNSTSQVIPVTSEASVQVLPIDEAGANSAEGTSGKVETDIVTINNPIGINHSAIQAADMQQSQPIEDETNETETPPELRWLTPEQIEMTAEILAENGISVENAANYDEEFTAAAMVFYNATQDEGMPFEDTQILDYFRTYAKAMEGE